MDESFNDEIREPDEVIREQLIEDTRCEFQKQMDEAMYLSMQEAIQQEKVFQEFEEQVINDYLRETTSRKELFQKLFIDINKIVKFDKDIKEVYMKLSTQL